MTKDDMASQAEPGSAGVLLPERICILDTAVKREALDALIQRLTTAPQVRDPEALTAAVYEREALMSTGIGLGVAVPHVRLPSVTDIVMAAGLVRQGVLDYESLDDQPVRLVFMVAARPDQHAAYLRLLARISTRMKDVGLRTALLAAASTQEFYDVFTRG